MSEVQLKKKIVRFLDNNFPKPESYEIVELDPDNSKIRLNYYRDTMIVTVGLDYANNSTLKLLSTNFV